MKRDRLIMHARAQRKGRGTAGRVRERERETNKQPYKQASRQLAWRRGRGGEGVRSDRDNYTNVCSSPRLSDKRCHYISLSSLAPRHAGLQTCRHAHLNTRAAGAGAQHGHSRRVSAPQSLTTMLQSTASFTRLQQHTPTSPRTPSLRPSVRSRIPCTAAHTHAHTHRQRNREGRERDRERGREGDT